MAEGRGSAMVAAVVLSLMLVSLHCQVAHAATYVVGGRSGWTFGLSNWPRGKNFKAGDILGNLSTYYQTLVLFVLFFLNLMVSNMSYRTQLVKPNTIEFS